jgi:uncharacterized protein GlcG (DUF336 family)
MALNLKDVTAMIKRAEAEADKIGVPVIIAVVDPATNLKAFIRMDGAVLGAVDIAIKKAKTAALFECNSEDVWEYCKPGAPAPGLEMTNGGLAPFAGGVLIRDPEGTPIGAVGVSGGAVEQDLQIALAAAEVVKHAAA